MASQTDRRAIQGVLGAIHETGNRRVSRKSGAALIGIGLANEGNTPENYGAGGTDTSTGTIVLWGVSFIGKTYTNQGGTTFTTPFSPAVASRRKPNLLAP